MAAVIVVGIGTSGLHILEEVQRQHYSFTGISSSEKIGYLYIDADTKVKCKPNQVGDNFIECCSIDVNNVAEALQQLRDNKSIDKSWLPSMIPGASVNGNNKISSTYTRTALWTNLSSVVSALLSVYNRTGASEETYFYVVGSLGGTSASGLLIDIAYLIRHLTKCNQVYGLMLLPNKAASENDAYLHTFVNSYIGVATLQHFSGNDSSLFSVQYPSGIHAMVSGRPYQSVQFISQDFENGGSSLTSLQELYTIAGLNIVLKVLGQKKAKEIIPGSLTRVLQESYNELHAESGQWPTQTSVGMLMLHYPKTQLEELVAIDIVRNNLLSRWIDNKNFFDSKNVPQSVNSLKGTLEQKASEELENILSDCITHLKKEAVLNNLPLQQAIEEDVKKIIKGKTGKPTNAHFLYQQFAYSVGVNYYQLIDTQMSELMNTLIENIYSLVDKKMSVYQNLYVIDEYLNAMCEAINIIKTFWNKEYGLTGDGQHWNDLLRFTMDSLLETLYGSVLQDENYFRSLINDWVDLVYFNRLYSILDTISENLKNPIYELESDKGVVLPSKTAIGKIIRKIGAVLDFNPSHSSLSLDYNDMISELRIGTMNQIIYLFKQGSCDGELKVAFQKYNTVSKLQYAELSGNLSLWGYLTSDPDIYTDCKRKGIAFVQKSELFSDVDIASLMETVSKQHPRYSSINILRNNDKESIKRLVPAMVPVHSPQYYFTNHPALKLLYLSSDYNKFKGILAPTAYQAGGTNEFCEIKQLKNTFVVYQEYARMNADQWFSPVKHLMYRTQALNRIHGLIDQNSLAFKEKCLPYINLTELETQLKEN